MWKNHTSHMWKNNMIHLEVKETVGDLAEQLRATRLPDQLRAIRHHRCALTPFVWAVHTNEGWKVYTIDILLRNIIYNNTACV